MTKRTIRHATKYAKAIPFLLAVAVLSLAAGSLLRGAWRWAVLEHRVIGGIVTLYAGLAILLLVLMLIREAGRSWLRWSQEQEAEDAERCVRPDCDAELVAPYAYEPGRGKLCISCVRRITLAAPENDLPALARKAGA